MATENLGHPHKANMWSFELELGGVRQARAIVQRMGDA